MSEEYVASALGFDYPEDLYRRLAWDGFPVCARCGTAFVGEDHCEPAKEDRRRETRALYAGGLLTLPLFSLAPRWMKELARVRVMPELRKQAGELGGPPEDGAHPVPLESGETIHVRPAAFVDEEKGYDRAEVLDRLLQTDVAILAALAVLEGGEGPTAHKGEPEIELLYAAYDLRTPREGEERLELAKAGLRFRWERVLNLTEAQLRRNKKNFKKLEDDERAKLVKANAKRALREVQRPLDLAEAEVRFYRGGLREAFRPGAQDPCGGRRRAYTRDREGGTRARGVPGAGAGEEPHDEGLGVREGRRDEGHRRLGRPGDRQETRDRAVGEREGR